MPLASVLVLPPSPPPPRDRTTPAVIAAFDLILVNRFNAGEQAAFAEIVARHRPTVFHVTFGLLRNRADAEEITQDTFIRAHRGLVNFRGDASLATWLYRIAVNLSRNRYWHGHRRHTRDSLSLDHALRADSPATLSDLVADTARNPAQESIASEFDRLVGTCMARLDARHREVLELRNVLHRSYLEIAAHLGVNVGTVKSRVSRAREHLRRHFREACPETAANQNLRAWFLAAPAIYSRPYIATP